MTAALSTRITRDITHHEPVESGIYTNKNMSGKIEMWFQRRIHGGTAGLNFSLNILYNQHRNVDQISAQSDNTNSDFIQLAVVAGLDAINP